MTNFIGTRGNKSLIKSHYSMNSFIGIRIGQKVSAESYPAIIEDGNTVGWYLADDLTTITKDGSNLVGRWNDKLGSGRDLIQVTTSFKPLWDAPDYIQFDGADNYLKTAVFTWNQPEMIYILFNQVTWTLNDQIFDGNGNLSGTIFQTATTPGLKAYAGASSAQNDELPINTWGVLSVLFSGVNSKFQIDHGTELSWNSGAANMGGFTLARAGVNAVFANIRVKEVINRKISDLAANKTAIIDYLISRKP